MTNYTVRYVDKLEIVENSDDTFGIKTRWLKLNLYKGEAHLSHWFNKPVLVKMLTEFDERGGFQQTVGYNLHNILYPYNIKIKMARKFVWSLQHIFKKPKTYLQDSNRIAECKRRLMASKDNLIIVYSIKLTRIHYPSEHLEARLVGFYIAIDSNPSIPLYSYNMEPVTKIKPTNASPLCEPLITTNNVEKPYISLANNDTIQITKSQWAHTMDTIDNTQKYYNKIIELLDNNKPVYYNGIRVNDVVLVTHRKTGNGIFIVNECGEFEKKVTDYTKFTTLAPITI